MPPHRTDDRRSVLRISFNQPPARLTVQDRSHMEAFVSTKHTAPEIARWMLNLYESQDGRLVQRVVARRIREEFGEEWTYRNNNRNWGIDKSILEEFRK